MIVAIIAAVLVLLSGVGTGGYGYGRRGVCSARDLRAHRGVQRSCHAKPGPVPGFVVARSRQPQRKPVADGAGGSGLVGRPGGGSAT